MHLAKSVGLSEVQLRQAQAVVKAHIQEIQDDGIATLGAEVTNVSTHCFWLLLGEEDLAVPFSDFPWFKKATIEQLADVKRPTEDHLYWPQLNTDLSIQSIRKPESFPLVSRGTV